MPAMANIVLADAQATPANHTFIPIGKDANGVSWYEDQSAASAIGNWRISIEMRRPFGQAAGQVSSADRVTRVKIGFHQPSLESLGTSDSGLVPAPTIAYTNRFNAEFILAERGTPQNRKDIRKMAAGLLGDSQLVAVIENLQGLVG